jgi:uncharacterized protein YuzE
MKISYDRDVDILMLQLNGDEVDHAEEMGPIIVHFNKNGKPILLEILNASDFLTDLTKVTMTAKTPEMVEVAV